MLDKLSSLTKFKASCPYLARTKSATLRTLYTKASPRYPSLSKLTVKATGCPVMGPALQMRSGQMVAGYASVAGSADVQKIHERKGVIPDPNSADIEKCPHASKAIAAARMADDLAKAKTKKEYAAKSPRDAVAAASAANGCPFHAAASTSKVASTESAKKAPTPGGFDYEKFYVDELEKKHSDASYRYFTNINRKAEKFPIAHTGDPKDEVEVWCANDYLGMGNNPIVLETMQCVIQSYFRPHPQLTCIFSHHQSHFERIWSWCRRHAQHRR